MPFFSFTRQENCARRRRRRRRRHRRRRRRRRRPLDGIITPRRKFSLLRIFLLPILLSLFFAKVWSDQINDIVTNIHLYSCTEYLGEEQEEGGEGD